MRSCLILLLLGINIIYPVFAQPIFALKHCIEQGLANNYDIRVARNAQKMADREVTLGNAGYLPAIDFSSGYQGDFNHWETRQNADGSGTNVYYNNLDQNFNAGVYLDWTLFDGLNMQINYAKLKELSKESALNAQLTVENFIAELSAEYYNLIRQQIQWSNLQYAVVLSRERLRIVAERYDIGSLSRLDWQQAKVDFNADSSRLIRQEEVLFASRVRLNQLMGKYLVEEPVKTADTTIVVGQLPLENKENLWQMTLDRNTALLIALKEISLGKLDLKSLQSANYPYLKFNAGYGYTFNRYAIGTTSRQQNLGLSYGLTLGIRVFDGLNRSRKQDVAKMVIENRKLQYDNLLLSIKSDFANLWMAYCNDMGLTLLERENVHTAEDNYDIAIERYKLGDLSGLELREAQNSLLEAEERLVNALYSTKLCEISLLQMSGQIGDLLK
ncbi:MAG: TolC family protein [Bacteroidales bacterium]|nr:TolC family protein [Bacteroidales bacterium]